MNIKYVIQRRRRRRTLCITITDDGKIFVKAPLSAKTQDVERFLTEKKAWILRTLKKVQEQKHQVEEKGIFTSGQIKQIKQKAKELIPQRVEYYSKLSGITYNRISLKFQKGRWGSCSIKGNLNFNCLLVLMPIQILDSVVIHELCHRRYMNHSKDFYAEIDKYFQNYKECDKWLKQHGGEYLLRLPSRTD